MSPKIHWYKLESHFGPGHQSTEIRYVFFNEELSEEDQGEQEQYECDRIANHYYCQCVTDMESVDRPPQKVIHKMWQDALDRMTAAIETLKVLQETSSTPEAS